ncbi:unnamed protein product, partial [Schistosoma turkestanicum]
SVTCFKRAVYLTPFDWRISVNLGIIYMHTSQWLSALQHITASINLFNFTKQNSVPNCTTSNNKLTHDISMLFCLLGYCLIKLNEYSKAYEAFMNAYKQCSKNPLVILNCTNFLAKSNEKLTKQMFVKYQKITSTREFELPYWVDKTKVDRLVNQLKTYLRNIETHNTTEKLDTIQIPTLSNGYS